MERQMLTTLNFNLRSGEGKRIIYAVVYDGNRQEKISMGEKVYKDLWDGKRQMCRINKDLNPTAINELIAINKKINDVKILFSEKLFVQLQGENVNIVGFLKEKIESMGNEKNLVAGGKCSAKKCLHDAFKVYIKKQGVKENTAQIYYTMITQFCRYIDQSGKDSLNHLKERGLYKYRDFLAETVSHDRANKVMNFFQGLMNKVVATDSKFAKYGLQAVSIEKVNTPKRNNEQKGKVALTESELSAIEKVKIADPKIGAYRDLFVLQCMVGVRRSMLTPIINKEVKIEKGYMLIPALKHGETSFVKMTPEMEKLINGLTGLKINFQAYNKAIKEVAKMAGLNRVIECVNTKGEKVIKPLHEVILSHDGRHTMITRKIQEGMNPDTIKLISGHTSAQYINNTYAHLTDEDKIKILEKGENEIKSPVNNTDNKLYEYRDVLAFYGCPRREYEAIKDPEELIRLIVTKYETQLEKEGINHTILKAIYNGEYKDIKEREKMEKILDTINRIKGRA